MTIELDLETVVAAITVISAINAAIFGIMNLLFVRRNAFFAIRAKDEQRADSSTAELHKHIYVMEGRFRELETQYKLLAEGPLKAVASTLTQVQQALGELNKQAEERNSRLIDTLNKLDHRLVKVETRLVVGN